jgi:hypothetical protein
MPDTFATFIFAPVATLEEGSHGTEIWKVIECALVKENSILGCGASRKYPAVHTNTGTGAMREQNMRTTATKYY